MIIMNQQVNMMLPQTYRAAIYCRLSKDDELQGESASISNQRAYLLDYCKQNGWDVVAEYVDDGYTGLNMDRPDLKRMLDACEKHYVNLVLTKDASRLGRNRLDTGYLREDFFPRNGVRYIAVNDDIDTLYDSEIAPFKDVLNEMYSKDISKKVHSSYITHAKQGRFTGNLAPFGYKKDPEVPGHLLIDEETAPIVRKIFEYALDGHGANWIRRRLEDEKIPCPTWYARQRGIRNVFTKWELKDPENGRFMWDFTVIDGILCNPVYIGTIASQKYYYKFKVGTLGEKRPEDWIVVEDMHEPIVSKAIFETVQSKTKARKRPGMDEQYSLFAGIIKCKECGKALTIRKTNAKHPIQIYSCVTYNKFGCNHCTQHRVEYDELYSIILGEIRALARTALKDELGMIERLNKEVEKKADTQKRTDAIQLAKDKERIVQLEKIMSKLYEDMIAERINEDNFNLLLDKAQKEQKTIKAKLAECEKKVTSDETGEAMNREWLKLIKKYTEIETLTPELLNRLIREIVVSENILEDGTRDVSLEIHFNIKPTSNEATA